MKNTAADYIKRIHSEEWVLRSIIPISFVPGTGGNFLTCYCAMAKLNHKIASPDFSEHGNSHSLRQEINDLSRIPGEKHSTTLDMFLSPGQLMSLLCEQLKFKESSAAPYFIMGHFIKKETISYISKNFNRSIFIVTDDLSAMEKLVSLKYHNDIMFAPPIKLTDEQKELIRSVGGIMLNESDCTLCISFTDLISLDKRESLTMKLSQYLMIPYENFDLEFYRAWQNKTADALSKDIK
jgi:hypothetical protein